MSDFNQDAVIANPQASLLSISGKGTVLAGMTIISQNRIAIEVSDVITTLNSLVAYDRIIIGVQEGDVSLSSTQQTPPPVVVTPTDPSQLPDGAYPISDEDNTYLTTEDGTFIQLD